MEPKDGVAPKEEDVVVPNAEGVDDPRNDDGALVVVPNVDLGCPNALVDVLFPNAGDAPNVD